MLSTKGFVASLAFLFWTLSALGDPGVSDHEILIGQSLALTGPTATRPVQILKGQELYFKRINAAGGVNGRKFKIITYDDAYDPKKSVENARTLINNDQVFVFLNNFGTPIVKSILPEVEKASIPLIAPGAGASFLRNPINKNIYNVKPGFRDEAESIVKFLLGKSIRDVGMFYQDDSFGEEGLNAVSKQLKDNGLKLTSSGTYKRNEEEFKAAYERIKSGKPKAVVIWGNSAVGSQFVVQADQDDWKPLIIVCSVQVSNAFLDAVKAVKLSLYGTLVFPAPDHSDLKIARDFKSDVKAAGIEELDTNAFEGYIATAVFVEAAKRAGKTLTRDSLRSAFEGMTGVDIGGLKVEFSPTNHQAFSKTYIAEIKSGKLHPSN